MPGNKWVLMDAASDVLVDSFHEQGSCGSGWGSWGVSLRTLRHGWSAGVRVLEVNSGRIRFELLPCRGLGIWRGQLDGLALGWRSPLGTPVHPLYVPLAEPSGFGFLAGPTELMFRCGLESNGTPDFDGSGRLRFGLHGYVVGIEPGTNLPNPRSFEEKHDRIVRLAPGETWCTSLALQGHFGQQEVATTVEQVRSIYRGPLNLLPGPVATWSPAG